MLNPSIAYSRLMRLLQGLDGAALEPAEIEAVREAADARLFGDAEAELTLAAAESALAAARFSGRLSAPDLVELRRKLRAIAPAAVPAGSGR